MSIPARPGESTQAVIDTPLNGTREATAAGGRIRAIVRSWAKRILAAGRGGDLLQREKRRIAFIDIGRALSALLVFYSHAFDQRVNRWDHIPASARFLESLTSAPLFMSKQGIGEVAVAFFFLISGFVVTPIALRQGVRKFAVNRICRLYPPMIFAVLLTSVLVLAHAHPPDTGQLQTVNPWTILTNISTFNYLIPPQVVLVPVAWTLIVEVIFYLLLIGMLPVFRRSTWLAIAIELVLVFAVFATRGQFGDVYLLFAVNVTYLPIPIIGQVIWACANRRIPKWAGGTLLVVAWCAYTLGDDPSIARVDNAYDLALFLALVCFLIGLLAEPRLRERRFWIGLSERSYSLYLLHMQVSYVLLGYLQPHLAFWPSMILAVATTFGVVEVSYRLVERPSHRLGRRLSRGRRPLPSVGMATG